MKKQILTIALLTGLAASSYAQGVIAVDNFNNFLNGGGLTSDTSSGLFFIHSGGVDTPTTGSLNITVLASTTQGGTYTAIGTLLGVPNGGFDGTISATAPLNFPSTGWAVNSTAWIELQAWTGSATTYGAATEFAAQSGAFSLVLGGNPPTGQPVTPPSLDNMPAVVLTAVTPIPEPGTFALCGLGAAAMLIFRRRK